MIWQTCKKIDGKEITVNLEDALFSVQTLAMLYANEDAITVSDTGTPVTIHLNEEVVTGAAGAVTLTKAANADATETYAIDLTTGEKEVVTNDNAGQISIGTTPNVRYRIFYKVLQENTDEAVSITISAGTFPGTYKIVGDTFARNRNTGRDELTWNSSLVA